MKDTLRAREILKRLTIMAAFVIFVVILNVKAYAADFNAVVSSGEATQGETVTVTVTMSSDVKVGAYDLALTYDANILEYVSGAEGGGGGSLRLYNDSEYETAYTKTITFKAKAAGSTKISVVKQGDICDIDYNDLTLKVTDGTVTVKAPVTASSNANLSSLGLMAVKSDGWSGSVTLMPEFSKDVTSYQLWLGSEFNKLSVSAVAEDGKAKVSTAGTELKAGQDNIVTITVMAEDGTVKTYTITVHVKAEENTTAAENNNTEAPTEAPTEGPTETPTDNPQDTTTGNENPAGTNDRNITISEKSYTVLDVAEDLALPEGFERKAVSWNGVEVMGASDQSGTLTLLYLQNNESGESSFYVYNSEKSSYIAFLSYTITQRAYVMLMADEDFTFEGGKAADSKSLELTTLNIAGGYVDAYKLKNAENIYIVKAMNWDNKIGYYYYNSTDGSMLPYFETAVSVSGNNAIQQVTNSAEKSDIKTVICFVLAVVSAALIVIVILLAVNVKRLSASRNENDEDENDEDKDEDYGNDEFDEFDDEVEESTEETSEEFDDEIDKGFDNEAYDEAYNETNEADEANQALFGAADGNTDNVPDNIDDKLEEATEAITEDELSEKSEVQSEVQRTSEKLIAESEVQQTVEEELAEATEEQQTAAEELSEETEVQQTAAEELAEAAEVQKPISEKLAKETKLQPTTAQEVTEEMEEQLTTVKEPAEEAKDQLVEAEEADGQINTTDEQEKETETEEITEKEEAVEPESQQENTAEQKEENMSEQELDSAIDDILGQLFK